MMERIRREGKGEWGPEKYGKPVKAIGRRARLGWPKPPPNRQAAATWESSGNPRRIKITEGSADLGPKNAKESKEIKRPALPCKSRIHRKIRAKRRFENCGGREAPRGPRGTAVEPGW